jgi:hypothetical protein
MSMAPKQAQREFMPARERHRSLAFNAICA